MHHGPSRQRAHRPTRYAGFRWPIHCISGVGFTPLSWGPSPCVGLAASWEQCEAKQEEMEFGHEDTVQKARKSMKSMASQQSERCQAGPPPRHQSCSLCAYVF